jgi:hypothetical protein
MTLKLWNQGVHTYGKVKANGSDVIIKLKVENMGSVRSDKTREQKCEAKGRRKGDQIQELMYGDKRNVEYETYDHTGNNWSHRNNNKSLKEICGIHTRKTFNIFTTKDCCT